MKFFSSKRRSPLPSIVVHAPLQWIYEADVSNTVFAFYHTLYDALTKLKVPFEIRPVQRFPDLETLNQDGRTHIVYHTKGSYPKIWHAKISYLPEYFYLDRKGFAGWAEICEKPDILEWIEEADEDQADEFLRHLRETYIATNSSKYQQSEVEDTRDFGKYLFLATQVTRDRVAKLAYIPIQDLIVNAVETLKGSEYNLVIKRHPKCESEEVSQLLAEVSTLPHVFLSESSIHPLIAGSQGVLTVNSGVGFESLIHLKPVFGCGKSDYSSVVHVLDSAESLRRLPELLEMPLNEVRIKKFLYQYLNRYLVKCDDVSRMKEQLQRVLD